LRSQQEKEDREMKIKILGAHNVESATTRLPCVLIDDVIALDAGSLTSSLHLREQEKVKAILLTHCHYDHLRDVAAIALNFSYFQKTLNVYSTSSTLEMLSAHIVNGVIYPRFTEMPDPPAIRLCPLEPHEHQDIEGYRIQALPVKHTVPTVGYEIVSEKGKSLFYSGDTGPGLSACWQNISPQLLIINLTMPNMLEQYAAPSGHLTPHLLEEELSEFKRVKGYLPPVVLIHLSPTFESNIQEESNHVAKKLGTTITLGREGMDLSL